MKEIGKFFRENFEKAENAPPSHAWEKISQNSTLKKYNRNQRLKRGSWYGTATISVITIAAIVFYVINNDTENNTATPQENTIATSEIAQQETKIVDFENMNISSSLFDNQKEESFSTKTAIEISITSSTNTYTPEKINTRNIAQEEEDMSLAKQQPITISISSAKNAAENPSTHNISLPNISIKKRGEIEDGNAEEDDENTFPDTEQTTHSLIHVANAFTPNNDGVNDIFVVYPSVKILDYQISIYDRSGQLVYHSNQIEAGWDGYFKGTPAPQGSYVYIITFTNEEKEKMIQQGVVVLIR